MHNARLSLREGADAKLRLVRGVVACGALAKLEIRAIAAVPVNLRRLPTNRRHDGEEDHRGEQATDESNRTAADDGVLCIRQSIGCSRCDATRRILELVGSASKGGLDLKLRRTALLFKPRSEGGGECIVRHAFVLITVFGEENWPAANEQRWSREQRWPCSDEEGVGRNRAEREQESEARRDGR